MTKYEQLLDTAEQKEILVIERYPFRSDRIRGLACDKVVALNQNISTAAERGCVLAEEIAHTDINVGNILDQKDVSSLKQEHRARTIAYNQLVGLRGLIDAYHHHCTNRYEVAEFLNVTESFLEDCLDYYKAKYGICTQVDNYVVFFSPGVGVLELK